MSRPLFALLVEDNEDDAALILATLHRSGYDVYSERIDSAPALAEALARRKWDIILSDYSMPSLTGLDALSIALKSEGWCPFIVVSGAIGEETAVELMRNGAHDCIMKDKLSRLPPAIERELGEAQMRREREEALESLRLELNLNATLAELSRNLIAIPEDIKIVAGLVLRYAEELTGCRLGYVSIVDPQNGELIPLTSIGGGIPEHTENILSVPVMSGESQVGQICLAGSERDCTTRDLTAIDRLADLFSIAVANYRTLQEKEQLSQQLRQIQKIEAIGTLASGIAHDFNNILAPMIGYAEMVQMCLSRDSKVWMHQEQVLKACSRAKELVEQILTLGRQSEEERKPTSLGAIVMEAMRLLRSSVPATIEIKQEIDMRCGLVLAVPSQIHQVVMNLCTNAYHAMKEKGGLLGVSLIPYRVGTLEAHAGTVSGEYVRLEVSDTGHGIARETMDKIFDPYFTTKKHGEGTGLGLSIVESIVRKHGGHISVHSEPGAGTSFRIDLPVVEGDPGIIEARPVGVASFAGNERIMIIDDVVEIVDMAKEMLEGLGYVVTGFTSAIEAFKEFSRDPSGYDLVITDMTMPNITGIELSRWLLKVKPGLPIILCSGLSENITEKSIVPLGIRKFLKKPILLKEYGQAIRQALAV